MESAGKIGFRPSACMDAGVMFPLLPARSVSAVLMVCALHLAGAEARAADAPVVSRSIVPLAAEAPSARSELRLGGFAHDPWSPERRSFDINGEFLLRKLGRSDNPIVDMLIPRLHIGGTLNTAGRTSNAYAGVTWTYDITRQLFAEVALGGAINNGRAGTIYAPQHNNIGCHQSFREAASVGWRFLPNLALMATVEHYSNAGLCSHNRGLTNFGARLAYSF